MKHHRQIIHGSLVALLLSFGAQQVGAAPFTPYQDPVAEKTVSRGKGGRDPFKKYEVPAPKVVKSAILAVPSIQERIDRYKAQKIAAMNARIAPPKPTTALLLGEVQVTGIFRTPRGYAAMVEALPIKLSYVIYPGEKFFDGQLVAIEESRLVFRRETVWISGKRDYVVEIKPLRQASLVNSMMAIKAPAEAPAPEPEKKPDDKSVVPDKP